jgi:predicted nucleotidyltransferase
MYKSNHSWDQIATQYRILAQKQLQLLFEKKDYNEILPTLYISRHYLELRINALAKISFILNNRDPKENSGHDLSDLWSRIFPLFKSILSENSLWNDEIRKIFNKMTSFINDQTRADKNSMALRYPMTISGEKHEVEIDVAKFCVEWNNCTKALEFVFDTIKHLIDTNKISLSTEQLALLNQWRLL